MGVAPAWAPHVAQLQVTPTSAKAGEEVTVYGPRGYGRTNPVEVRWGPPTGSVLGTFAPNEESYAQFGPGKVTIPADAKPGTYQMWATQLLTPGETYIRGVPSQATVEVVAAGGAPALGASDVRAEPQSIGLEEEDGVNTARLAVIAFGVGGIALFFGGVAAIFLGRRSQTAPTPETAQR
ncbi:MAG: hypothetical protein ACRD2W_02920 [Acidimicrobiales bacterium]